MLLRTRTCFLAAALLGASPATIGQDCEPLPGGVIAVPGSTLRLDDVEVSLLVDRYAPTVSSDVELRIHLLVRPVDRLTKRASIGVYVPHLDGSYTLGDGADPPIATGKLGFRLSPLGPSYGTTVPLDSAGETTLSLDVVLRDRSVLERRLRCPQFPLELRFEIDLSAIPLAVEPAVAGPPATTGVRFNLIGSLDPNEGPGDQYSDMWGWNRGQVYLAIVGGHEGTHFIDVTNAANPVEVAFIPGQFSVVRDIKTYGDYAYIVSEAPDGLQIVDLTTPTAPVLANQTTDFFFTAHNLFIDEDRGHAWIVGANNGTRILDLSQDPVSPTSIGSWTERYVHDAHVKNDWAYFSEGADRLHEIFDSSDVANLQLVSSFPTLGAASHNSWVNEDETLLVTTDEVSNGPIAVYDVTSKPDPNPLLAVFDRPTDAYPHNVMFDGGTNSHRVGVSHYHDGVIYLDLTVPEMPVEIASYDTFPVSNPFLDGCFGVYTRDRRGYIYASDISTGLYIVEYAPDGGLLVGTARDAATLQALEGVEVVIATAGTSVSTASTGRFAAYHETGSMIVRLSKAGYQSRLVQVSMPLDVVLELDLDLQPLPESTLAGTVRRSDTLAPISGATVRVEGTSASATSLPDGSYSVSAPSGQYLVVSDAFGFAQTGVLTVVADGPTTTLDLFLDPTTSIDDFESDLGWTPAWEDPPGLPGQWERVDPNGTGFGQVQPENDHTPAPGTHAYITGQSPAGAGVEVNDVDEELVRLLSPWLDFSAVLAPRLIYYMWLSNSAGPVTGGDFDLRATPDDGDTRILVDHEKIETDGWQRRERHLTELPPQFQLIVAAAPLANADTTLEVGLDDVQYVSSCTSFNSDASNPDGDENIDACDPCTFDSADDADGDGFCGDVDNTPFDDSPNQDDTDGDLVGDAADNCPLVANADQTDSNGNGLGNACDPDLDGDGTANGADPDQDDDGVPNAADLCPIVPDPPQQDFDDDGEGDACDPDDGIVRGVRLDGALISWSPEVGSDDYNLYRAHLGSEFLLPFAVCRMTDIRTTYWVDPILPTPGDGFAYVVTRTAQGVEGSPGTKSDGSERVFESSCP